MREFEKLPVHLEQAPPIFQAVLSPTHCSDEKARCMWEARAIGG